MKFLEKFFDKSFRFTLIVWAACITFLFFGNMVADTLDIVPDVDEFDVISAVITEITDIEEWDQEMGTGFVISSTLITFNARITGGEMRGRQVIAEQFLDGWTIATAREVEAGDRILIIYNDFNGVFEFVDYVRINYIIILGAIFFALMLLFGGKKGLNSIVALGFTCMAIFMVLVPAILGGRNIYLTAIVICVFIIVSTLLMVIGPNKKALSAMLGCLGGVILAAGLMFFMDVILNLTGIVDHDSQFLLALPIENQISLNAIVFAGVIIGAVGAVMDVAMSISSSLWEVKLASPDDMSFSKIFKSGINIGKDIMGTMLNTLILAYIGSSLSLILLMSFYFNATSFVELFNREMIVVEFLRALIGSFGIFLAVPLTSGICGWLYAGEKEHREEYDSNW